MSHSPDHLASSNAKLRAGLHAGAALGCAAILWLMWTTIYTPHAEHTAQLRSQHNEHIRQSNNIEQIRIQRDLLRADIDRLSIVEDRSKERLREIRDISEIMSMVTDAASQQEVTIHEFRPERSTLSADMLQTPITLKLSGPFDASCRFLLAIEHLPHCCRVTRMDVSRKSGKGDGTLDMTVLMTVYSKPQPAILSQSMARFRRLR